MQENLITVRAARPTSAGDISQISPSPESRISFELPIGDRQPPALDAASVNALVGVLAAIAARNSAKKL